MNCSLNKMPENVCPKGYKTTKGEKERKKKGRGKRGITENWKGRKEAVKVCRRVDCAGRGSAASFTVSHRSWAYSVDCTLAAGEQGADAGQPASVSRLPSACAGGGGGELF